MPVVGNRSDRDITLRPYFNSDSSAEVLNPHVAIRRQFKPQPRDDLRSLSEYQIEWRSKRERSNQTDKFVENYGRGRFI